MPITPFTVKNGLTVGSTSVIGSNAKLHANNAITDGTIKNQFLIDHGNPTGTFGSGSKVPVITVDSKGRITNISNANISGVSSTTWSSANNNFRISTSDGSTYDTVIGSFVTVANADVKYATWNSLTSTNTAIRSYVDTEVAALVNSAPTTLDTLNELAAALGDDPNFATTLTTNLGQKLGANASITLSGDVSGSGIFSANAVSISVTVADDSHNHVISNIDGLSAFLANTNAEVDLLNTNLTSTNTAIRSLVSDVDDRVDLLNTNLIGTNTDIRTLVNNNLANTNAEIDLLNTNLTSTNTALRLLISDRIQVANADTKYATWTSLTGTNTDIRTLVNNNLANTNAEIDLLNTNLTSTNTDIRTLVNNNLANTNAEIDLLNTNLTSTNTSIRTLVNNNLANTNAEIDLLNTNLTSTNTAIRSLISDVSGVSSVAFTTANNNFRISTTNGGTYDATISILPVLGYINSTIEGSAIVSSSTYDAGSVTQSDKDAFGAYISGDILDCMEPSGQVITADCGALT